MGQGWVHNPNLTPSSYPMKFWSLFGMVMPIAHTTQQYVISDWVQFAKSDGFHWSRHNLQYLNQYPISPDS